MRQLKHHAARRLRRSQTEAEHRLWQFLRSRQLDDHKFRRQQPIGSYVVDLVCMERRPVVELDGGQHQEQEVQDRSRTQYLEHEGFKVIRFWNDQVLKETSSVLETILGALNGFTSGNPSPCGRDTVPRARRARVREQPQCRGSRTHCYANAVSPRPLPQGERARSQR